MLNSFLSKLYPGLLSGLTVLAILWLTLAPHPLPDNDIRMFEHADKLVHALMFGGLVFSMVVDRELWYKRRYEQTGRLPRKRTSTLLLFAIGGTLFGGAIELLQGAMELGRGCDPVDFLADAAGAFLSAFLSPRIADFILLARR